MLIILIYNELFSMKYPQAVIEKVVLLKDCSCLEMHVVMQMIDKAVEYVFLRSISSSDEICSRLDRSSDKIDYHFDSSLVFSRKILHPEQALYLGLGLGRMPRTTAVCSSSGRTSTPSFLQG